MEFVSDAAYVCAVIGMITNRTFHGILHRLPNSDTILELSAVWDVQRFRVKKVKSHRQLDTAKDLEDLWKIAGNHCADLAAGIVLQTIPDTLKKVSNATATFQEAEGHRLTKVFQYMAHFNKARVQACAAMEKDNANHNRNLDQPKKPPARILSNFDSEAMGQEAFVMMRDFCPQNDQSLPTTDLPDDLFQMCPQGANLGKALFLWAKQLQGPADYGE